MDEETVGNKRLAAGIDMLAGEAHTTAIRHFFRGVRAVLGEMLQNAVIGSRHPVSVKALDILLRVNAEES